MAIDNITLARLLDETAALLEIDAADPFRIRSYRRAAEAVEQQTTPLATLAGPEADPKALLAIPGIGKGMAANIRDLVATGTMPLREELLKKYKPSMLLELLRLPGMGPKTVSHALLRTGKTSRTSTPSKRQPSVATCFRSRASARSLRTSCSKASRTTAATPHASASISPASTPSASPN